MAKVNLGIIIDAVNKAAPVIATVGKQLDGLRRKGEETQGGVATRAARGMGAALRSAAMIGSKALTVVAVVLQGLQAAASGVASVFGVIGRVGGAAFRAVRSAIGGVVDAARSAVGHLMNIVKWLGIIGAVAVAKLAGDSIAAASDMEGYLAKLTVALKDQKKALDMLNWAKAFAAKTPFEMPEVVDAVTRLEMYGLSAKKWLPLVGDMAGAMGKSVTDAVEAVADAVSGGGLERLKEFGISTPKLLAAGAGGSKKSGDSQALKDAQELNEELRKSGPLSLGAQEAMAKFNAEKANDQKTGGGQGQIDYQSQEGLNRIKGALETILTRDFGGGMDKLSQTAQGMKSNFMDSLSAIRMEIGQRLMPTYKAALKWGMEFLAGLSETGAIKGFADSLAGLAGRVLTFAQTALPALVTWLQNAGKGLSDLWSRVSKSEALQMLVAAVQQAVENIRTLFGGFKDSDAASVVEGIIARVAQAIMWLNAMVLSPGALQGVWDWAQGLYAAVSGWLVNLANFVGNNFTLLGRWFTYLVDLGKYLVAWFYKHIPDMAAGVAKAFAVIGDAVLGGAQAWNSIRTVVVAAVDYIVGAMDMLLLSTRKSMAGWLNVLHEVVKGLNGIPGLNLDKAEKSLDDAHKRMQTATDETAAFIKEKWAEAGRVIDEGARKSLEYDKQRAAFRETAGGVQEWADSVTVKSANVPEQVAPKPPQMGDKEQAGAEAANALGIPPGMLKDAYGQPVKLEWVTPGSKFQPWGAPGAFSPPGQQITYSPTISVDARGAGDPQAVKKMVDDAQREAEGRFRRMFRDQGMKSGVLAPQ